jgi:4-amino-4-deoxy-L-arabinose transferase-like glycosyltransferase
MALSPHTEAQASNGNILPLAARHWPVLLAFLISAWAVFGHLGGFPLLAPDEGRNAEVAREMKEAGAWLVPTYDGATYLDKPAFFFKAVALSLAAFGESEWAARLPSALFGFGLAAALFGFCRRVYDTRTAALAMVVVASTPLFIAFSRIVIFDMTLAFFVCGSIFAAYLAEEHAGGRRRNWYLAAAFLGGVATLVKGPVGFLIPLLVMAAFHASLKRYDALKRLFAPAHGLMFLAVVLPWFVGLSLACPDFPYYGIMRESIARFTTPVFRRTQPFYFYGQIIASCFFAWSLVLPESIAAAWRRRSRLSRPDRLFIVWALVVVAFFSLSKSKLPGYILTGVVALGVLAARVYAEALRDSQGHAAAIVRRANLALLLILLPAAAAMTAIALHPERLESRLKVAHEVFARFVPLMPMAAASLGLMAALAAVAYFRRDPRWAFAAALSVPLLLLTANFEILPRYADTRSARALAGRLPSLPKDAEYACLSCFPPGLPFYLKRLVTLISDDGKELTSNYVLFSLASGKPWPERIVSYDRLESWLQSRDHPVYLIAKYDKHAALDALAAARGVAVADIGAGHWAALLPPSPAR